MKLKKKSWFECEKSLSSAESDTLKMQVYVSPSSLIQQGNQSLNDELSNMSYKVMRAMSRLFFQKTPIITDCVASFLSLLWLWYHMSIRGVMILLFPGSGSGIRIA